MESPFFLKKKILPSFPHNLGAKCIIGANEMSFYLLQ